MTPRSQNALCLKLFDDGHRLRSNFEAKAVSNLRVRRNQYGLNVLGTAI